KVQRLLGLHALGRIGRAGGLLVGGALGLEVGDVTLQSVVAAIEDEIVGQLTLIGGNLRIGRDVVGVDHGQVQAGLDAVVEEHAVEHRAGGEAHAEGDVGDAQ